MLMQRMLSRPIEITFYKPLDEPTLRFANANDFDTGTITNAENLISGSDQQIGSMLEIPVKGFVDGFDSANYDLSMLISNVPEYVSFWLLKDGEYQQVGTSFQKREVIQDCGCLVKISYLELVTIW